MFLVSSGGKTVLYSADFRSTGRSDFNALLETLPEVDVLITEGTTLSRGLDFHEPSEQELEDFAVETLRAHKGPSVVYLSAQNVERKSVPRHLRAPSVVARCQTAPHLLHLCLWRHQ